MGRGGTNAEGQVNRATARCRVGPNIWRLSAGESAACHLSGAKNFEGARIFLYTVIMLKQRSKMGWAFSKQHRAEKLIQKFYSEKLRERNYFGDQDIDRRLWTGLVYPRTETGSNFLFSW